MKFIAIILSIITLSSPLESSGCCIDYCDKTEQQNNNSESGCPQACSPFTLCSSCTGFTIDEFSYSVPMQTQVLQHFNTNHIQIHILVKWENLEATYHYN